MHKLKKETKGGRHDPIFTHPEWAMRQVNLMGEVGVVIFLLGGWTLAPRRNFENFPRHLPFLGFPPANFLIRAKMHKLKKETKGRTNDPILTPPEYGHKGGGPDGEVGVVVFLSGGWALAPRRKLENWDSILK